MMSECAMQDACGENCGELDDAYDEIERLTAELREAMEALRNIAASNISDPHLAKIARQALANKQ